METRDGCRTRRGMIRLLYVDRKGVCVSLFEVNVPFPAFVCFEWAPCEHYS